MLWFFNLSIGTGGLIIGMITFADEIASKIKYFSLIKSLYAKIPFFLLGSFMIIWGSIQKDNESENKSEQQSQDYLASIRKMDSTYKDERVNADKINEKRIREIMDSSYIKSIKASNEALAKFNIRLVDSLHTVANGINLRTSLAQLDIDAVNNNGLSPIYVNETKDGKQLNVRYASTGGTSYNLNINTYIIKELPGGMLVLQYMIDKGGYSYLVPDRQRTMSFNLDPIVTNSGNLLIVFLGKFSRTERKDQMIDFKSAFSFDFKNNKLIEYRPFVVYPVIFDYLRKHNIPI